MKGYRMSIIRHGKTIDNEKNSQEARYIGITDIPLSPNGKEELKDLALTEEYPRVQQVYSSPLKRAVETAEILFPQNHLITVEELREMDFGDFEGKTLEQLVHRPDYKKWLAGGKGSTPPGGETAEEMLLRLYNALNVILKSMMEGGYTHVGVVTHAGILMNMLAAFGLPKGAPLDFACQPGEGFQIVITPQMWMNSQAFEIVDVIPEAIVN